MDKGSRIWSWNMKRSMITQKANMSYTCPMKPLTFVISFFLPLLMPKTTNSSKEEKGKEGKHAP